MTKLQHLFSFALAVIFATVSIASMAADPAAAKGGAIVLTDSAYAKARSSTSRRRSASSRCVTTRAPSSL